MGKTTKWRFPLAIFDYDSGYHKLIFGKLSLARFALAQCLDHLDSSCPHCQFKIVPNPILSPLAKVAGPLDTPYLSCIHSLSILLVTRHLGSIFRTHPMPTWSVLDPIFLVVNSLLSSKLLMSWWLNFQWDYPRISHCLTVCFVLYIILVGRITTL